MSRPRKRFAQHWLNSLDILYKIVAAADLHSDDCVLEIGPGTGNLTEMLLPWVRSLIAVEIDRDLCRQLRRKFKHKDNFELIEADLLQMPLPETPNKVVANIPYNITSPILHRLMGKIAQPVGQFDRIVLLVQKEIGDRLTANPGTKAYNALSIRTQYLADCEYICDVPPKAFTPPPKVSSAVVSIMPRSPLQAAQNPKLMDTLISLGFATRRKMLHNNLGSVIERDRLLPIFEDLEINPKCRAENLTVSDWVRLSDAIDRAKAINPPGSNPIAPIDQN
ncbi:Ribosomal RNA small subunit methyltransferase A [Thalassoporum mexicanum PCC 7367]|uniref:16S rRNA (adenine(1518)-N(6)/adenine(1519)-N(6))- dimethyltransferase RsmA n=1 Tax=Thalassoporum mexicanum TaxID=3457544 RepID=UPI00029FB71B|nr:16S rRNA (adenine(1518)-N(6)/adenine(1519)-N(6))-dimethyltransferase RsmA [Pseudanabaena sp. PCC 7367]AFY70679.1 Ribosomal RNA small subunit methyltransferase A [Pseudanabaena sp. PCC 7367]